MCPLRIILIFLSATLAGFFVLRNLKSQPTADLDSDAGAGAGGDTPNSIEIKSPNNPSNSPPLSSKVCGAIGKGFWTCVDMASGRYLWRNLVGSQSSSSSSSSASKKAE